MDLPIKVLIVDDDQICREILADALVALGIEAALAGDGIEGLEKLARDPFDILITDLNMPRMDGLTLLQEARQHYPHILTIVITGYGTLQSAIEAIRAGTYDYIQKPFKIEEIQIVTRNAIEKIQMLREKNRILEELRLAYGRLQQLESERESKPAQSDEGPRGAMSGASKTLNLFPRHTLPLALFEKSPDEPNRVLAVLERLKDLRRHRIINDEELERLKRNVLDRMDSLSV
ncbi:MAG TPA: response regulator [Syntrophobacteraceae bacterium]|nr:response regulator [Syntrophobacteraceae bacterium]